MIRNTKEVVKKILHFGHRTMGILDNRFLKQELTCQWPPIFILGPPRSGTTLLNQLMINTFRLAYFPNIANTFYMCPIFATQFGLRFCRDYQTHFTSHYGFEKGCMSPSEGGNIWNRWFPHEKLEGYNYTPANYLNPQERHLIHQVVAHQERMFHASFLNKNLKMSVRLQSLHKIFPKALLIQLKRNLVDSAVSILIYRRKFERQWWSVIPKEFDEIKKLSEFEQVSHQVFFIEQNIEKDIQLFSSDQLFVIHYHELCEKPIKELEKIQDFLTEHGLRIKRKNNKVPSAFSKSKPVVDHWISKGEIQSINKIITDLLSSITA